MSGIAGGPSCRVQLSVMALGSGCTAGGGCTTALLGCRPDPCALAGGLQGGHVGPPRCATLWQCLAANPYPMPTIEPPALPAALSVSCRRFSCEAGAVPRGSGGIQDSLQGAVPPTMLLSMSVMSPCGHCPVAFPDRAFTELTMHFGAISPSGCL